MGASPQVFVEADAESLASAAAQRTLAALTAALRERPVAHLVVTGGGILEQVMRAVRSAPHRDDVDWARVQLWWGDERFVAPDSADRNDRAAFAALFDGLTLDPSHIHRMPSTASGYGEDLDAAARAYAIDLADAAADDGSHSDIPAFDVILLGLGPDGHCASLFPGHPALERDESVLGVRDSPKPPPFRISLSFRALDAAREIYFIASGAAKSDAVARALTMTTDWHDVPSARPRGTEKTLWLVDEDAAAEWRADGARGEDQA